MNAASRSGARNTLQLRWFETMQARWLDTVVSDLKVVGVQSWKTVVKDSDQWRTRKDRLSAMMGGGSCKDPALVKLIVGKLFGEAMTLNRLSSTTKVMMKLNDNDTIKKSIFLCTTKIAL